MTRCCPHCGAKYATREPLCARCGLKLYGLGTSGPDCRVCTAPNPAGATYCVGCGWRLAVEPPAVMRPVVSAPLDPAVARPAPSGVAHSRAELVGLTAPPSARTRPARISTPAEPVAASTRRIGGGCLGVAAALALALTGAVFASGHIPHTFGLLPTTWRVESAEPLEKPVSDLSGAAFSGSALESRGARQGFDLPLTSGPERRESPGGDVGARARALSPSGGSEAAGRRAASSTAAQEPGSTGGAKNGGVAQVDAKVEASAGTVARPRAARDDTYAFTLRDLKTQPVVLGRWRLEMQATLENVSGAPLAYDSMTTRLVTVDGVEHLPLQREDAGAMGILPAGQSATFAVAFMLPADLEAKTLRYEGVRIELIR